MLHASTQKLIVKLCELTDANEIAWREGPGGETSVFESEGYVVEVIGSPPTVRLLCSDGRELERADEAELATQPWPGGDGTFATHVLKLAASASRLARGAEIAISRILSSLSAPPRNTVDAAQPLAQQALHAPPPLPEPEREAESAIERVLSVQSAATSAPAPETQPPAPLSLVGDSEATALVVEPADTGVEPPPGAEAAAPASGQEPALIESEATAVVVETETFADEPASPAEREAQAEAPPVQAVTEPLLPASHSRRDSEPERSAEPEGPDAEAPASGASQRSTVFGATASFAREPKVADQPKVADTALPGLSASSSPSRREPVPQPLPRPAAKPAPPAAPERVPEPAGAGPDVYKPWS